jgi:hypothetical protein
VIGSPLIGAWIAHIGFWVLTAMAAHDARWRLVAISAALWVSGYILTGRIASLSLFFMPFVAALDVALVLMVLRRDVRLS